MRKFTVNATIEVDVIAVVDAMNHIFGDNISQVKAQARSYGHIIVGKKCYCDQECFDEAQNFKRKEKQKCVKS